MSRTATVILAIVCVAAGAGGAFLALRSDRAPVAAAEQVQAEPAASGAVAESEGVIERAPVAAPAPVVPEPAPAPRSRPVPPPAPRPPVRQTASAARTPVHVDPPPPVVAPDQRTVVPIAPAAIADNQASRTVEP